MNLAHHQRGASVSGMVLLVVLLVVCAKIGLAIIPAQIGHYQLKKSVAWQLKNSNDANESGKQFLANLANQWNINGYRQSPEQVIELTNTTPGSLAAHLHYAETNNFFGNVDIVNRFDDTISASDAKSAGK